MPKKRQPAKSNTFLKSQLTKIGLAVVKIQETLDKTLPTLATKTELAQLRTELRGEMASKTQMAEFEMTTKKEFARIETKIDNLDKAVTQVVLLKDHEQRMARLEEKAGIA